MIAILDETNQQQTNAQPSESDELNQDMATISDKRIQSSIEEPLTMRITPELKKEDLRGGKRQDVGAQSNVNVLPGLGD